MKIGVIGSAGGSAFQEVARILGAEQRRNLFVITDRECGMESVCDKMEIRRERLTYSSREQFSSDAALHFRKFGADFVILYFSKLVTEELFQVMSTINIHPSLLPAFPGMSAVKNTLAAQARFLGCTAHVVDSSVDGGAILAQSAIPIDPITATEEQLNKLAFIQKVYLSLVVIESIQDKKFAIDPKTGKVSWIGSLPFSDRSNPCLLTSSYISGVDALQQRENTKIF